MKKGKILVIDDEIGPRESLRILFKDDYEVLQADCGEKGIEILKKEIPDLIILDLKMPGMDGIKTLEEIRKIDEEVPVIILTGYGTYETAKKAMHFGAIEFISKPFDVYEMKKIVNCAIEKKKVKEKKEKVRIQLEGINKELQKKMEEMESLATLGKMSAEVIHEINNPLTVIQGYIQLLADELSRKDARDISEIKNLLILIQEEMVRCQSLTRTILSFSKKKVDKEDINIVEIINKIITLLKNTNLAKNIKFDVKVEGNIPIIKGDPNQIHQAFTNILLNSIEAIGEKTGGKIDIMVKGYSDKIDIIFKDNGPGIPEEIISKIFEPFYTTKGTGLGLFITKKIIERHKGKIKVESEPGKGTSFYIKFPIS
ncbi:MAG: hypothetical protein DRP67_02125 [Candidatus Omnitrophota bacterium]|nr:MAG: hypothetical protein DRP67_02125 [Candidatus Omnitrophota bacterium]